MYAELGPFGALETGATPRMRDRLWLRGGFPDSFLARGDAASLEWRHGFVRTVLERDIPQLGPRVPAETLRRLWTMLAHAQGAPLNAARLASGLGLSGQTVMRYVELLADLLLVRRLEPWSANLGKRLCAHPSSISAIAASSTRSLGIGEFETLLSHLQGARRGQAPDLRQGATIKLTATPGTGHLQPLRKLLSAAGADAADTGLIVCRTPKPRELPGGHRALPWHDFPDWLAERLGA